MIETIFSLICLAGLIASGVVLIVCVADYTALRGSGQNGARLIVARANVRSSALRVASLLLLFISGVLAILDGRSPGVLRHIAQVSFVCGMVLIAVNSIADLRVRRRLFAALDDREENG